jgi:hypothetical protein
MLLPSIKSLAVLALASTVAQAAVVTYNWTITYVNANPDGLKERRVVGVNGQYPYVFAPCSVASFCTANCVCALLFISSTDLLCFAPTLFGACTVSHPSMSTSMTPW